MNSFTEENYLKAIFKLLEKGDKKTTTNAIAEMVNTAPASVTDMLKKLNEKHFINYEKYQGVSLTASGKKVAVNIIRKHRLWELFLVDKLKLGWDEVHPIAEELEHINSDLLIKRLDNFLNHPRFDPHGDPIPDEHGIFHTAKSFPLSELNPKSKAMVSGVIDHSPAFLQYIQRIGLELGKEVMMKEKFDYDKSCNILLKPTKSPIHISYDVAKNILVLNKV
jgi:DtxR family transcriptional regulator, Mn-dependent transcriptional regulator